MIRVAAVGDLHVGLDSVGRFRDGLAGVSADADVLLVAGDLTKCGTPEEAEAFANELSLVEVPIVAVLGNHDHHDGRAAEVAQLLRRRGVTILEGEATELDVAGLRMGVAGAKGFGGGFAGASASAFGERQMKDFVEHSREVAASLQTALERLSVSGCDIRIALTHYSPVPETLDGERLEIYPFLGSQYLGEAIDNVGAALALHGHAHHGSEHGVTPGGVPVRNVALPVIRRAYRVYDIAAPTEALASS